MSIKKKLVSLAVAVSIAGLSTIGCYGSYAMFDKVQRWNGSMGNKWVASVVHYVLWVVPVYGISLFADFLIFNTIEFWTGSNPLAMGDIYEDTDQYGTKLVAEKNADGTLTVNMADVNGNTANFTLERVGDEVRVLDATGEAIAFHRYVGQ